MSSLTLPGFPYGDAGPIERHEGGRANGGTARRCEHVLGVVAKQATVEAAITDAVNAEWQAAAVVTNQMVVESMVES